jgi:hypothetical protein
MYHEHTGSQLFSMMDPVHPTQAGHDLEAETLYGQLVSDGIVHSDP